MHVNVTFSGLPLIAYILTALGTYAIAKRRGINKPWTAWIPIANLWLLGCISDQYRHVAKNQVKTKRRSLVVLSVISLIAVVLLIGICVSIIIDVYPYLPADITNIPIEDLLEELSVMSEDELESFIEDAFQRMSMPSPAVQQAIQVKAAVMVFFCAIFLIAAIMFAVQMYMAYFDLFASSNPGKASLYLTLGIFEQALASTGILLAVFVYLCRDKDEGMPTPPARVIDTVSVWDQPDPPCYEL